MLPVSDRVEIQELMARYAWCMDMGSTDEEFLSIFTTDAVLDSPISGHHAGVEGVKQFHAKNGEIRNEVLMRHFISNYVIDGEGDRARLRAYFILVMTPRKPRRPRPVRETEFVFVGGYDCEAVKLDDAWRLKRRTVTVDAHP